MKLIFIITIIALGLGEVFCTMEVGPYEAILHNVTSCVVQQPWFQYNMSTYTNNGRKLMHGTVVTLKELKDFKGAYDLLVHNTSTCVVEQPWFHSNVTAYTSKGKHLLRGTVVVKKEMKNMKFGIKMLYMEQGQMKAFELKSMRCHNMIVQLVLQSVNLQFNKFKCTMMPTTGEFDSLNLNYIVHKVAKILRYGYVRLRWEITVSSVLIMCLDINVNIVKAVNR